ncbi:MAG: ATP-dependent helicase/nuclease subunit B [Candidatus Tokpelaia sp. JSC189]|nr:MAG: ATP-dependent helicase/nuclease subunit B [Candidatus Tokpelaia sp. JSC189]
MRIPRLFSIPPGAPFLPTFVEALQEGRLTEEVDIHDPLTLTATTIYVPTRRAARALRSVLVEASSIAVTFLPTICPLGDIDEQSFLFAPESSDNLALDPPIAAMERLLLLAQLIRPWRERLPNHVHQFFGHEEISLPANTADAIWLARDLSHLMDEIETEEANWADLKNIAPDMVAEWWQVTLDFLDIVTINWPQILKERCVVNPAFWRNQAIRRQAAHLAANPQAGPVLVAGSTGSLPATAELIKTIAFLPKGAVVLPGLDRDLDAAGWKVLSEPENDPSVFGHPQYGLKKLLHIIKASRSSVENLGKILPVRRQRETIVAQAFRPATTTDEWNSLEHNLSGEAFHNVALLEASNEREEALAIAIALRTAIEEKQKTAALITSDRNLARRVCTELSRFGIRADDSSGAPLLESEPTALIRLLLACIFEPGDPVSLLSLLKHPLVQLGQKRAKFCKQVEYFELFCLRGGTGRVSLSMVDCFIAERLQKLTDQDRAFSRKPDPAIIADTIQLGQQLTTATAPLHALAQIAVPVSVAEAIAATIECFENFGRDENGSLQYLYACEAGQSLMQFLHDLVADRSGLEFSALEWPKIFESLIAGESVQLQQGGHPRLHIWGAIEARLQTVDTIVIGGLNEGTWPTTARNDPFMSRTMKKIVGLEPPERRIGLSAHDFQMALGMDHVILTRSLRLDNAPSIPSRWLQRLETVLRPEDRSSMRARGYIYLNWAQKLDEATDVDFITRPCPTPPVNQRPRHFSVIEIETLRRDPYAIYARKILRLNPLDPLIRDPSATERGTLYHNIVAAFTTSGIEPKAPDAQSHLLKIARMEFDKLQLPLDIEAIWWPRFLILVPQFLQWEANLGKRQRLAEITASPVVIGNTEVELSGRADRIDLISYQHAEIIDFKTGSTPSVKQAAKLMAPQLALEGALLSRSAFADCGARTPSDLLYIRLTQKGKVKPQSILKAAGKTAVDLAEEAWMRLNELVKHYQYPENGYLSHALLPTVNYKGDYDHLARVWEWSSGITENEE